MLLDIGDISVTGFEGGRRAKHLFIARQSVVRFKLAALIIHQLVFTLLAWRARLFKKSLVSCLCAKAACRHVGTLITTHQLGLVLHQIFDSGSSAFVHVLDVEFANLTVFF